MHGRKTNTLKHRGQPLTARRGSVLILVVGVLVLLAISAAVYVGVGQQERLAASASEAKANRDSVSAKLVDNVGQILVLDLFGVDPTAKFPFEDRIDSLGFGNFAMGERWDFPYTRPGGSAVFNVLADPWLADLEPVDSDNDGNWDIWRHISNVHPQGKFVSLAGFFSGARGLGNNSGFYSNLYIGGGNADPYSLDTYTNANRADPFDYNVQMGRQFIGDADDSIVTWADRMLGTDTDGDGRIDARWTELPDVTGLPKEMRIFAAFRIVDASAMLNLNANLEFGDTPGGQPDRVSLGRTPADVDLYTLLFDGFQTWNGPNDDNLFVNGPSANRPGFKQHVFETGIQSEFLGGQAYSHVERTTRREREDFWTSFARNPYRPGGNFMPYGVADEMELRTFMFTINDRATSRLEGAFDGLNLNPGDPLTWHSPLRNRYFTREQVDLYQRTPDILTLQDDYRHLLTTYNGSMPIRPWNRGYAAADSPAVISNLNSLLASNSVSTAQTLTGGFMWALAPYAVDIGNLDGTDSGYNLFGSPVIWQPTGGTDELHYGDGDAGHALYKSAQLALNAIDCYDSNSAPTIRTLVVDRNYTAPGREGREIVGSFEHGRVPMALPGPSGDERGTTITVMGLERQPFIREVSAVNVYGNLDGRLPRDDEFWNYDPIEGNEDEWMVRILAIELGNPWPNPIKISSGYKIKYGDDPLNVWTIPADTPDIPAGEGIVLYIGRDNPTGQVNGLNDWESEIRGRRGWDVKRIGGDTTHLEFSNGSGSGFDDVTLWQTSSYGVPGSPVDVLIDRIRPATPNGDFPNIIPLSGERVTSPNHVSGQTEFTVRVGSIRRYCAAPAGGGMPGYMFESPVSIATNGRDSGEARTDDPTGGITIPSGLIGRGLGSPGEYINDSSDAKGYASFTFAPFELYVANLKGNSDSTDKDFRSSVDLLLLSTVGSLHCQQISGGTDPTFSDKHYYVTASELLGDEALRSTMTNDMGSLVPSLKTVMDIIRPASSGVGSEDFRLSNGAANRFVGRLDFTRFIPRSGSSAMITQAVPLATRVIDAFDTVSVDPNVPLAQGRININTAPRRVLETLPFLNPRYQAGPIPQRDANLRIAESLRAYRDRGSFDMTSVDWSSGTRATVSNLTIGGGNSGLRDDATSRGVNGHVTGFTSAGELLLATRWAPVNGGPSYAVDPTVLPGESAYLTGRDSQNLTYEALNPNGLNVDASWETSYDPTDDPSEHLALIRAIRNSVSTRSDVFVAYMTLVGFTPDDIQRAQEPGGSVTQKLTRLQASMEQRYVVVFDRSGVKSPSDRPRVLFAAQEVPTR